MDTASAALRSGDRLIAELKGEVPSKAAENQRLKKVSYTHEAMIELILSDPWITQNAIASHFGYTPSWISTVLASDAFQAAFATRKDEVVNPELKASIEERFKALVLQSIQKLQEMLEKPSCPPQVALRSLELGAKALGVGGNAPAAPPQGDHLARLAERLVALKNSTNERTVDGTVLETKLLAQGG